MNNQNGGLFSRQQCRLLSKKIIQAYDGNGDGIVDTIEVGKMLCDCYRAMNKDFKPTATDIASYVHVIDRSGRGKITFQDMQHFIFKYFHCMNKG